MSNYACPPENEPKHDPEFPPMPVETEIYILPSGEVVIADLPAELAARLAAWHQPEPDPPSPLSE